MQHSGFVLLFTHCWHPRLKKEKFTELMVLIHKQLIVAHCGWATVHGGRQQKWWERQQEQTSFCPLFCIKAAQTKEVVILTPLIPAFDHETITNSRLVSSKNPTPHDCMRHLRANHTMFILIWIIIMQIRVIQLKAKPSSWSFDHFFVPNTVMYILYTNNLASN